MSKSRLQGKIKYFLTVDCRYKLLNNNTLRFHYCIHMFLLISFSSSFNYTHKDMDMWLKTTIYFHVGWTIVKTSIIMHVISWKTSHFMVQCCRGWVISLHLISWASTQKGMGESASSMITEKVQQCTITVKGNFERTLEATLSAKFIIVFIHWLLICSVVWNISAFRFSVFIKPTVRFLGDGGCPWDAVIWSLGYVLNKEVQRICFL